MDLPAPVSPVSTVRPGGEVDLDGVDDRQVADLQVAQHVLAVPSVPAARRPVPSGASSAAG